MNAVEPLDPALHLGLNAGLFEFVSNDGLHLRQKSLALFPARIDGFLHLLVSIRIEKAEAQVFQFAPQFSHAEPMSDGRVDLKSLFGNFALPIGLQVFEGSHVVQSVGQLDQNHPDVVDHGEHHLAQIFGLRFFSSGKIYFADLGDALDDVGNLLAELFANVDDGDGSIFDGIVKQPGGNGHRIHLHLSQNQRHFEGMDKVGLARSAGLAIMILQGIFVGFFYNRQIVVRTVFLNPLHQLTKLGERKSGGRDLLAQARHVGL